MQNFQRWKLSTFYLRWSPAADHNAKPDWSALRRPACKLQQQLGTLVRELLLSTLDTGMLLSGLNTCLEFAPVAMEAAKCSAGITSVGVYWRIANLMILSLWGREINMMSKCWKWDGTLHVSKHNLSDEVRGTVIVSALLHFISISGPVVFWLAVSFGLQLHKSKEISYLKMSGLYIPSCFICCDPATYLLIITFLLNDPARCLRLQR